MPPFRDFLSRQAAAYRGLSNKYVLLTNGSSFTDSASIATVVAAEVLPANGYARIAFSPASNTYDSGQGREEIIPTDVTFTASGGSIQFDRAVVISGAAATTASLAETSSINSSTNTLAFAASNVFTAGTVTTVTVTAGSGGTVPSELLDGGNPRLLYVVNPVNSGTFSIQLSLTNGGSAIDFGSGASPLRVHNCSGNIDFYSVIGSTTIADGASQTVRIGLNLGNNAANVDAT